MANAATPSPSSSSVSTKEERKFELAKQIKTHNVALAELSSLSSSSSSSRAVYQKNCNIYFKTTVQKATFSEQKHLDIATAKMERLNQT